VSEGTKVSSPQAGQAAIATGVSPGLAASGRRSRLDDLRAARGIELERIVGHRDVHLRFDEVEAIAVALRVDDERAAYVVRGGVDVEEDLRVRGALLL